MVAILDPRQPRARLVPLPKPPMLTKHVLTLSKRIAKLEFSRNLLVETVAISLFQLVTFVSLELAVKLELFAEVMTEVTMEVIARTPAVSPLVLTAKRSLGTK